MRYIERLLCASAVRTCSSYPKGTPVILAGWHPCGLIYGRALTSLGLRQTRRGGAAPFTNSRSSNSADCTIHHDRQYRLNLFHAHQPSNYLSTMRTVNSSMYHKQCSIREKRNNVAKDLVSFTRKDKLTFYPLFRISSKLYFEI